MNITTTKEYVNMQQDNIFGEKIQRNIKRSRTKWKQCVTPN